MSFTVAVVGCGSIGKRHIRNLLSVDKTLYIIPVDTSRERLDEVQSLYGLRGSDSLTAALDAGADVVFITLPTGLHLEVLREAVAANCHLFVEKPIAASSEGVAELLKRARAYGAVGFMGSNFKFHPSFAKMKQLVDGDVLGNIYSVRVQSGQYLPDWHPWEDYRQGYSAQRRLGGGILLDAHEFIYTSWLLGEVQQIACMYARLSDLDIDTEDTASILMRMSTGAQVEMHLDYTQRAYQRSYEFHAQRGTLLWDIRQRSLRLYSAETEAWTVWDEPSGYTANDMYLAQTRHFLDCLHGQAQPLTTLEEGLYILNLTEYAKRSSETQTFVTVKT